jgi:hypothetical protein
LRARQIGLARRLANARFLRLIQVLGTTVTDTGLKTTIITGGIPPGGNAMASVPFDQLEGEIWFNGEFVPWKDAKVHVLTHGLHYASAVFEGERAYGGEIFKLTEHTERLHTSAISSASRSLQRCRDRSGLHRASGTAGVRGCLCPPDRLARI